MSSPHFDLKRTPIFSSHQKLGAKIVPFAGWEMPVLYSGVIDEHNATRNAAGLFDVSHMGEIRVRGKEAEKAINFLSCNDIRKITDNQAQYAAVLNEKGGVVDDIIVYRFSREEFLICVNASNTEQVFSWMQRHNKFECVFENESSKWGQIAIQGPKSIEIAERFFNLKLSDLKYFRFQEISWNGGNLILARTGYTGEDGLEIFVPTALTKGLWDEYLEFGKSNGLQACGLGARDTLRLESALPLHGHELSESWSALQSGLDRFIDFNKDDFIGSDALIAQQNAGLESKLAGFILQEAGIARQGDKVFTSDGGKEIGIVTSGTKTPTINKALGLALIDPKLSAIGTKILIEIRGKKLLADIVSIPFYKRMK